jgi:hypothetical protein
MQAIVEVLDSVAADHWQVEHVSEDRAVDHAAGSSYVIAVRYLLTRGAPTGT